MNNSRESNRGNRNRLDWMSLVVGLIYETIGQSKNREANDKYRESQDRASRRTANATVWMAIFTLAIFVTGIFQYLVINNQLKEMRDQTITTRAQIRANIAPQGLITHPVNVGGVTGWLVNPT